MLNTGCLRRLAAAYFLILLFIHPALEVSAGEVRTGDLVSAGQWEVRQGEALRLRDEKRGKDLPIQVVYPRGAGPFAVVIFSHGAGGSGRHYRPLAEHWASHGRVKLDRK